MLQVVFCDLDTPSVLVDLDRLEANITRMAAVAREAGVQLRPHAKSHKLPEIAELQLAAGAVGLTVAKLGEAEVFVDHGVEDVFIAYPLWGAIKWRRLCDLAERARVSVSLDSEEAIVGLAQLAAARGIEIPVRVELDSGFERCGVGSPEAALALARIVAATDGVAFEGLMSFAGQSYEQRTARGIEAVARHDGDVLLAAAQTIRAAGIEVPVVSAGGTPTARGVAAIAGITEIRPGAYALSDRDQAALGWGTLADCAVTVLTTVVSRPTDTRAVIDAGSKTMSSDPSFQDEGWGVAVGRPELRIRSITEEHGIVELPAGADLPLGTRLQVVPNHGCGTINMHDQVTAVRGGEVIDTWRVRARARVQ
jgi:D-serine deaminase-like pyridoxal phosphate-dependent protein